MQNNQLPPTTFGDYLAFLRKRARLTQGELGRAVGYSREQITRLERNQRAPDAVIIGARFVPALGLSEGAPEAARLLELAGAVKSTAGPISPENGARGLTNVPAPLLPLIGRSQELRYLTERLRGDQARLITVLGAAGVGKTRLAIQAAIALEPAFPQGVWFVSLAALTDAAHIASAVLQVLEPETIGVAAPDAFLVEKLRDRQLLLVLDNLEQLDGASEWIGELLSHAPHVKVLATSRAPLDLYGEFQFPLMPLTVPRPDEPPLPDVLARIPSVVLFVSRTHQVQPSFVLSAENGADVAALCVQLDGLPLALELAAAQMNRFSVAELRAGLADQATYFSFPARNVPERHHSLTNALAWSYDHLSTETQRAFEWLGVFPGGATVDLFERLGIVADARKVLDALTRVSLTQVQTVQDETRYTMYETVRQFAREKMAERGELNAAEERHAELYVDLAERVEPQLTGADQQQWLELLERERDNWRRALSISLASGHSTDRALQLCNGLWKFWRYRCDLAEGYEWTTRALSGMATGPRAMELRAGAEWGAGVLAAAMQREELASTHLEASLALWQTLEDDMGVAAALTALGARAMDRGEFERAVRLQTQALGLYTELYDAAAMAYAHNALGETWRAAGDYPRSREHYQASLELARRAGHARSIAVAESNLGSVELALGDLNSAREKLLAALPTFVALDDRVNIASCIATLACIKAQAAMRESMLRATRMFGFATGLMQRANGRFEAADAREFEKCEEHCRSMLGVEAFDEAWQAGSSLALDEVVALIQMT